MSQKRRSLTAELIVTKAMDLADAQGVDALSMRKVAGTLGTTAMAIYNHVDGKDALLDLMLDRVVANIQSPDIHGVWDDMLRRRAHSLRHALLQHPWAAPLLLSRIAIGPAIMHDSNATVGCLVTSGFSYAQADWARNAIDNHVYGFTIQELNFPVDPDQYRAAAAQYLPMISKTDYPFVHGAAEEIINGKYDGKIDFSFGLELILDGLKRWKAQQ